MAENKHEQREKPGQEPLRQENAGTEEAGGLAGEGFKALSDAIDAEVTRTERANVRQLHDQRKVRIVIPSGRSKHDRMPVILGVNGREYLIVRDREIAVPEGVVNVLNLAREKVAVTSEVNGQQVVEWEEAQRIPFQILGYVEPAGR